MSKNIDGEIYLTANEAAKRLHIARDTFQRNVAPHLKSYMFAGLRYAYYKKSDVDAFAGPRPRNTESEGTGNSLAE